MDYTPVAHVVLAVLDGEWIPCGAGYTAYRYVNSRWVCRRRPSYWVVEPFVIAGVAVLLPCTTLITTVTSTPGPGASGDAKTATVIEAVQTVQCCAGWPLPAPLRWSGEPTQIPRGA